MVQIPDTGLPIGTTLVYNATIDPGAFSWSLTVTPLQDLIAGIKDDLLSTWGLEITSSSNASFFTTSNPTLQLQLQMNGPNTYAVPGDIQSIVDGEIANYFGGKNYLQGSNISSFTLPPSVPGGAGQTQSTGAPAVDTGSTIASTLTDGLKAIGKAVGDTVGAAVGGAAQGSGLSTGLQNIGTGLLVLLIVVIVGIGLLVAFKPGSVRTVAGGIV